MRTRKKSKMAAGVQAVLWLLALSAALVMVLVLRYDYIASQDTYTFYYYHSFVEQLQMCGLVRYWEARCDWDKQDYDPSAVLLDDESAVFYTLQHVREGSASLLQSGESGALSAEAPGETYGGLAVYEPDAIPAIDAFNNAVRENQNVFDRGWSNLFCTVLDNTTGASYSSGADLSRFVEDPSAFDSADWGYITAVYYNINSELYSVRSTDANTPDYWYDFGDDWGHIKTNLSAGISEYYDLAPPRDVTFIFAIPRVLPEYDAISGYLDSSQMHYFYDWFGLFFIIASAACVLLALWFGRKRGSGLGGARLAALPVEIPAVGLFAAYILGGATISECVYSVCDSSISLDLQNNFSVDLVPVADALALSIAVTVAFAFFGAGFLAVLAIRQGFARYGWKGYLLRHSIAGRLLYLLRRIWRLIGKQIVRLWYALTRVDLRDSVDHTLARLLAVNFVIVTLICCLWFFGIFGAVVYTVVLFFLLRGRLRKEQEHYNALLDAARRMAGGDLTTPIAGDLGMFEPLREELNQVRDGFEKAVAAEVRSQNMKTELISNVSHDLKTPLTAIITYVDLLKDPDLPEADRVKYIETLDRKSQRLKRLIEDLFEVSKAATGNVTMHYTEVDLASLLKQVQYELADKLQDCGVDFRWQLPEGRVPLVLDGQKTCRIFENLLINITKYGMPGTRAYITLEPEVDGARIVFKNISADELDFDAQQITERFVRGDKSRNTEGSGLGLAIVKSFAELQGGSFEVSIDGDLFKAVVTLKSGNLPEALILPEV